jgi:hypothetical protein
MADHSLTLTADERACLVELLEMLLKEAEIEEHRTRTPSYRQNVIRRETLIKSVLTKLGRPAS